MSAIKFTNNNALFFNTLRERVDGYFKQNDLKKTGNFKLYSKTIILLTVLTANYIWLVFFTPSSVWVCLALCALMGINFSAIGFNVMHDGSHGSYSTRKWVNEYMSHTLSVMGGSAYLWNQKHNINHHTFTNIEGVDDDIDVRPFIRIHPSQKKRWHHRFQHIYCLFLYSITYLFWVFYRDFIKYFTGKVAVNTPLRKMNVAEHIKFWGFKLIYVLVFLLIPIFRVGLADTLIGYSILAGVAGVVLAVVFQLAHVVKETEFVTPETNSPVIENDWAVHQVTTTVNFATRSKTLSWLLGGLNFQIEHHLFPRISHIHYPKISKIVKETCREFNVAYHEFPTMLSAIRSHLIHLKNVGMA